jgi:hypothetical protein
MNKINKLKQELILDITLFLLSCILWFEMFYVNNPSLIITCFFLSSMFFGIGLYSFIIDACKLWRELKR